MTAELGWTRIVPSFVYVPPPAANVLSVPGAAAPRVKPEGDSTLSVPRFVSVGASRKLRSPRVAQFGAPFAESTVPVDSFVMLPPTMRLV